MRIMVVAVLAGFLLVVPAGGVAQAKTCELPEYPSVGRNGDYDQTMTAKRISCADAYKVMDKFYQCRIVNGPAGRCVKKVKHFGCSENRYSPYPDPNYSSWVTCTLRQKKIVFHYWQNLTLVRAATCAAPAYPATDGAFNPEVKAKHLSCAKAEKVMLKHYACRTEAGPEGRCVHRINKGFACQEERYSDFYAPDYQATVTCKRNNKKVVFGYSQTKYDS